MSTQTEATSGKPQAPGKISGKAQVPQKKRDLLPPGDYLLAIKWVEKTMAKNGSPRLSFRFQVAAGQFKDRYVFEDCYLTEAAQWKVSNLMALVGLEGVEVDPNDPVDLIEKFQDKKFKGHVKHEKFTNKDKVEVTATRVLWGPPPGSANSTDKSVPADGVDVAADKTKSANEDIPF